MNIKCLVSLFVGASTAALLLMALPSAVEGYDGPSQARWVAATAWRTMGAGIIYTVATQCGQGGITIYEAKWQSNCNLVVYKDFNPTWSSNTRQFGYNVCYLALEQNGNLVIYGERGDQRIALWSSNSTQPYEDDFYLSLTLYGSLGVFTSDNKVIWSSNDSNDPWP